MPHRPRTAFLFLVVLASVLGPEVGFAAILDVRLEATGGAVLPPRLRISAEGVAGNNARQTPSYAVGHPSEPNPLEVEPGVWRVFVEAKGLWANEQLATIDDAKETKVLVFKMWPTGRVAGRVDGPKPPEARSLEATFESPPGRKPAGISRSTVRCPLEEGAWSCELPATELDVEFRLKGFVSQHRFGLRVPKGQALDLGSLSFRRGASIEGIVKTAAGARAGPPCRVSLKTGFGEPVLDRERQQPIAATLNERGFYQLVGMGEGPFVLEAEQRGWARTGTRVVVVDGNAQVKVPPLVMDKPEPLELVLRPPLDPSGKPWVIELLDAGSGILAVGRPRPASPEGVWREEGLGEGPYIVNVADSSGDRWLVQTIVLPAQGPVPLEVEVLHLTGTVRLGEEPLQARLFFGGRFGAIRVVIGSDDEGRFRGTIPKRDSGPDWEVYVTANDPPVNRTFVNVKPEIDSASGEAVVELVIPDVRLKGKVVDEQGKPCPCIVDAQSLDQLEPKVQVRVGGDGIFDIVGLPPGRAEVICDSKDRSSGAVSVQLSPEKPTEVTLVAHPRRSIKGRVVTPEGEAVAGAVVHAFPNHLPKLRRKPLPVKSGADGSFAVAVPQDTREATLMVGAIGFALTSVRVSAVSDEPAVVRLSRYGGTLVLDYPRIRGVDFYSVPAAYLVTDLYYELLENAPFPGWATANLAFGEDAARTRNIAPHGEPGPTTLLLPQMAAGSYSLCLLTVRETLDVARGRIPADRCAQGVLAPGGTLPLRMGVDAAP